MKPYLVVFFIACLFAFSMAGADQTQVVSTSELALFADPESVSQAVRNECQLEAKLPQYLEKYAKKAVVLKPGSVDAGAGRVLVMQITGVQGAGGGAWSGAKSVSVKGELFEDGVKKASFRATRRSGGGAFGGYKGTCSIMGRCVKSLGKDIAQWLQAPTLDARLGDAK